MDSKLKAIDLTWHHVFNQCIKSGLIKDLGANEYCVLSVIKSFVNLNTGSTIGPTRDQISELTGFSVSTVKRALSNLYRMKKIIKQPIGRSLAYKVVESLQVANPDGTEQEAKFEYIPVQVEKINQELKKYRTDGTEPRVVQIINIQINDNSVTIHHPGQLTHEEKTKNKEKIQQLYEAIGRRFRAEPGQS